MIIILFLMVSGVIFGIGFGKYPLTTKITDKLLSLAIYVLLLLLGIAVGSNERIIKNLSSIGFHAFVITIGVISGSVAVSWVIYRLFFKIK